MSALTLPRIPPNQAAINASILATANTWSAQQTFTVTNDEAIVLNQTLTGANAQSALDIAITANTSGTPTGIRLNWTDTASAAGSLLMDLRVGGASQFSVSKVGTTTTGSLIATASVFAGAASRYEWSGRSRMTSPADGVVLLTNNAATDFSRLQFGGTTSSFPSISRNATGVEIKLADNSGFTSLRAANIYANNNGLIFVGGVSDDIQINRDAADVLALRRTTNAQTLRVYETFTDSANLSRLKMAFEGGAAKVMTEALGTGTSRILDIGTVGASNLRILTTNTVRWEFQSGGNLVAATDNANDIGASGANRPRNVYVAGFVTAGGAVGATRLDVIDGITAPSATPGAAKIYVDTADGDLKVIFGDGVIKTIATDT